MIRTRVIPSLLLKDSVLVKTTGFARPRYVGDPINAVRIFNDKEADELAILDISASRRESIDFDLLSRIAREAFMPLSYGGGIRSAEDVRRILGMGFEKIVLNLAARERPELIREISDQCGSQSVVVCIDSMKSLTGEYRVFSYTTGRTTKARCAEWAKECVRQGAGEILLNDVSREGTGKGYDVRLIRNIADAVDVPVIAMGGAATIADFSAAIIDGHASAVAAGSMFVFHGPHKAVLITYPSREELRSLDLASDVIS